MKSQNQLILNHLKKKCITPIEALELYGCFRLGGRIWELRNQGYDIKTTMVSNGDGTKRFARYKLIKHKSYSRDYIESFGANLINAAIGSR